MAQRTVCLCDDEYIGIETIFTIVNGKQINIPDKLKELRIKSKSNKLFCPCGCGSNLILVAGDRNLREQHFRLKDGAFNQECRAITEGKVSIESKIVLKCWLDEKLKSKDIKARVPICQVDDNNRKFEFTFLSESDRFAISYCNERSNLLDEKLRILDENSQGISVVYVVSYNNFGTTGQYPESLMKIQNRQGYCIYLKVIDADYYKAELIASYYLQDINGLWVEKVFVSDKLYKFDITEIGKIIYKEQMLDEMAAYAKEIYNLQLEKDRNRRAEEEQKRVEEYKALLKQQEEVRKKSEEQKQKEKQQREESFKQTIADNFTQQKVPVRDADGNRWIKCEFCGKIAKDSEFNSYGGGGHVNLGTCYECSKKKPQVFCVEEHTHKEKRKINPNICPECGGQLKEKIGRFGVFMGCSNYPDCKFTRKI